MSKATIEIEMTDGSTKILDATSETFHHCNLSNSKVHSELVTVGTGQLKALLRERVNDGLDDEDALDVSIEVFEQWKEENFPHDARFDSRIPTDEKHALQISFEIAATYYAIAAILENCIDLDDIANMNVWDSLHLVGVGCSSHIIAFEDDTNQLMMNVLAEVLSRSEEFDGKWEAILDWMYERKEEENYNWSCPTM